MKSKDPHNLEGFLHLKSSVHKQRSFWVLLIGAVLSVAATTGCASQAQTAKGSPPPPPVEVATVQVSDVPIFSDYPAQTYARNLVEVRCHIEGLPREMVVPAGLGSEGGPAALRAGPAPYDAAVRQASGNLKQSEADLEFAKQQVSVLQAEANLAVAQANTAKAQQDYDRLKPLVEQDAAAKQELDTASTALSAAQANVRAFQANLDQARLQSKTQIDSNEGKVEALRGALQNANLNVQYGTIKAPISGLIGDTLVPVGGLVTPSSTQPLTTIVPLDPIWVRFKISESEYLAYRRRLMDRAPLDLVLADDSQYPQRGQIENTQNQVDPKTGTLELQARFPNPRHTLLPGQFGRVRFQTEERKGAIVIPQRAVQQMQSAQMVYTLGPDNKVQARPIVTGPRVGDRLDCESGLAARRSHYRRRLAARRPGMAVHPEPYQPKAAK